MSRTDNHATGAARRSIDRHIVIGLMLVVVLVFGVAGWALVTEIAGAVIAEGRVVAESHAKAVQHPTGGVVSLIAAEDDGHVGEGDLLIRLDDTMTRASLAITTRQLDQLYGRKARLEAERDHRDAIAFPDMLTSRADDGRVARIMAAEEGLFAFRGDARDGQRRQLAERISQFEEQITGLVAQQKAKRAESALITREADSVRVLWQKELATVNRLYAIERDEAAAEGGLAELAATVAQVRGRIAEIHVQIIQIDQQMVSEVAAELGDIDARIDQLEEQKIAQRYQLDHTDIRAPRSGTIHELAVHTVGGVIAPGDVLMRIVPDDGLMAVEARVGPQDIDELFPGQPARLHFSAFNRRTTPEIEGRIAAIAPDVSTDQRTGASFYTVRVTLPKTEIERLDNAVLIPGMPVETYIQTGRRSAANYLLKPFRDIIQKAFRET